MKYLELVFWVLFYITGGYVFGWSFGYRSGHKDGYQRGKAVARHISNKSRSNVNFTWGEATTRTGVAE